MLCAQCPGREPYEPSDWYLHIEYLYRLRSGGYPFGGEDLSIAEWLALGELDSIMGVLKGGVRLG